MSIGEYPFLICSAYTVSTCYMLVERRAGSSIDMIQADNQFEDTNTLLSLGHDTLPHPLSCPLVYPHMELQRHSKFFIKLPLIGKKGQARKNQILNIRFDCLFIRLAGFIWISSKLKSKCSDYGMCLQ